MTDNNLKLCAEDDSEPISSYWFLDALDTVTLTPLVELSAERVCFEFDEAEFTGGKETVAS
jgi:hypothetical protein